jgi:hypothetical protein
MGTVGFCGKCVLYVCQQLPQEGVRCWGFLSGSSPRAVLVGSDSAEKINWVLFGAGGTFACILVAKGEKGGSVG